MKKVTIALEESDLEWARIQAARENKSLSRLIGELIGRARVRDDAYERAMRSALKFRPLPFAAAASPGPT